MRRRCSFSGCQSGTASDRSRNQACGLRNPSLFKFPNRLQNIEQRKQWEDVLGREANDNEVLCELHFLQEDLRTSYELALSNGANFKLERGKISLNSTAIPRAQINNNVEKKDTQTSQATCSSSEELSSFQKGGLNSLEIRTENHSSSKETCEAEISPQISTIKMEKDCCSCTDKENIEMQTNIPKEIAHAHRTSPLRDVNHHSLTAKRLEKISSASGSSTTETDSKYNVPGAETIDISDKVHIESTLKPLLTLKQLNNELKDTPLPDGWLHILLKDFMMIGHYTDGPAKKEFSIGSDGQVQVFFNMRPVSVHGIHPATTITNVLNNIQLLQPLLLCDGIGLKDRYCETCEGYVQPIQSHVKYGHVRCDPCHKTRQKIIRMESKRTEISMRMKYKLDKLRKHLKNEKRKRERLEKTVQDLKQELQQVKKQCALVQKAALEGKMKRTRGCESIFLNYDDVQKREVS